MSLQTRCGSSTGNLVGIHTLLTISVFTAGVPAGVPLFARLASFKMPRPSRMHRLASLWWTPSSQCQSGWA